MISIHAPTRGATGTDIRYQCSIIDFNPRSHEGSDWKQEEIKRLKEISIHAPTRGATRWFGFGTTKWKVFQSTLPRGERPITEHICLTLFKISIHAPTRGATEKLDDNTGLIMISIHAPTRGATKYGSITNLW